MTNLPDVSVIIPMYNAENYIAECLNSLLNQTLKNIEVIVVDDCSTDNSLNIAMSFTEKFGGRLNLMKLSGNSGHPGIPRNFALEVARGKYVYFLDSDDFIDTTALEDFYNVAEEFNGDVVHSEKYFELVDGVNSVKSFQSGEFVQNPTLETLDIGERVTGFVNRRFVWWGCNKLFRREFLIENKIKFPQMTAYEDFVFTFCCVASAKNYVRVPFVSYHYRIREGSLAHNAPSSIQSTQNLIEAVKVMDNFMREREFFVKNHRYRYAILDFFVQLHLDAISKNLFITSNFELSEVYAFLSENVFSKNPEENVALTSYLFVTMNVYKLLSEQWKN